VREARQGCYIPGGYDIPNASQMLLTVLRLMTLWRGTEVFAIVTEFIQLSWRPPW